MNLMQFKIQIIDYLYKPVYLYYYIFQLRREKLKQLYNREYMEFEQELGQRFNKTFYKKRM